MPAWVFSQELIQEFIPESEYAWRFTQISDDFDRLMVSRRLDYDCIVYDRNNGVFSPIDTLPFPENGYCVMSPNGNFYATGSRSGGEIRVFDYSTGSLIQIGAGFQSTVLRILSVANDGRTILIGNWQFNAEQGFLQAYKYSNGTWEPAGQAFEGTDNSQRVGYNAKLIGNGRYMVQTTQGNSGIMTTWEYIDGLWVLIGSIADEPFADMDISSNGRFLHGSYLNSSVSVLYEFIDGDWVKQQEFNPGAVSGSYHVSNVSINEEGTTAHATYSVDFPSRLKYMTYFCKSPTTGEWFEPISDLNEEPFSMEVYYAYLDESGDSLLVYNGYSVDSSIIKIYRNTFKSLSYAAAYIDYDQDLTRDSLEPLITRPIFQVDDSQVLFGTTTPPYVRLLLDPGENYVSLINDDLVSLMDSINIAEGKDQADTLLFPAFFKDPSEINVNVDINAGTYLCNDTTDFDIVISNYSPLTYNFESLITVVALDSTFTTEVYSMSIDSLNPLRAASLLYEVPMPTELYTGEILTISLDVIVIDPMTGNAVDTLAFDLSSEIRCSYDPNDKTVFPTKDLVDNRCPMGTSLQYRVRFQNTGNFLAEDVVIRDYLDLDLDWSTFKLTATSHPISSLVLNTSGEVVFSFNGINLPDSTSNLEASQGYVMYTIEHLDGLPDNTDIKNTAYIYFDRNDAIVTNTAKVQLYYPQPTTHTIDVNVHSDIRIWPNPASSYINVEGLVEGKCHIYDLDGRLLTSGAFTGGVIDLTGIDRKGLLIVKCISIKGKVYTKTIVKM